MAVFSFWMLVGLIGLLGVIMIIWLVLLFTRDDRAGDTDGVRD